MNPNGSGANNGIKVEIKATFSEETITVGLKVRGNSISYEESFCAIGDDKNEKLSEFDRIVAGETE